MRTDGKRMRKVPAAALLAALVFLDAGCQHDQDPEDIDRAALVALYEATGGADWRRNFSWHSDVPLHEWYGVSTGRDGRVTSLVLPGNDLTGTLPVELGDLAKLRRLSLPANHLTGPIPAELGNLANLEELVSLWQWLDGPDPAGAGRSGESRGIGTLPERVDGPDPGRAWRSGEP